MRIGILGTRGVPPRYGGFETFVAELGARLVRRGHEVTIYCRVTADCASADRFVGGTWQGITRVIVPAVRSKYLETVSHTFLSAIDALRRDFEVVLVCNAANAFTLPILRAVRLPVVINVDGIERRRRKWNMLGRAVYLAGEAFSVSFASAVVADAHVIADYYRAQFGREPVVIPYGSDLPEDDDPSVLERLGLRPREYILYVSRFEPENNPLEVVLAYEAAGEAPPLVMVGEGLYAHELVAELHRHASERVRFPGAIYGPGYRALQRNALFYIQATEVGGTHPALIEAMGSGGAVLANDTPENREVGGGVVGYFELGARPTLSAAIRNWLDRPDQREGSRGPARERARSHYGWEGVTDAYERLFQTLRSGEP